MTHVLIIGWRAGEEHAVALLDGERDPRRGLMPGYSLGIASGSQEDAREVYGNLGSAGTKGIAAFEESDGFSGLIARLERGDLADFLSASGQLRSGAVVSRAGARRGQRPRHVLSAMMVAVRSLDGER